MATLVPIGEILGEAPEPDRILSAVLRLTLTKLGFLLPIFVDGDNRVVAGHHRFEAAKTMGLLEVPVERLDNPQLAGLVAVATDEALRVGGSAEQLTEELVSSLVSVPDRPKDRLFRCLETRNVEIRQLAREVRLPYDRSRIEACRSLLRSGLSIPVVVGSEGRIVNGHYRVVAAFEDGVSSLPCVTLEPGEERLAKLAFDLVALRSAILHRMKSFARIQTIKPRSQDGLTPGLRLLVPDGPKFWARFRQVYGTSVLDLACGENDNRHVLSTNGILYHAWDPFPTHRGVVDPVLERRMVDELCEALRNRVEWSTVLVDRTLDMLPYAEDRWSLMVLAHACCSVPSLLVGTAERPSTLVQPLQHLFAKVEVVGRRGFVARWPRRIDWGALEQAVRHEFELVAAGSEERRKVSNRVFDSFRIRLLDKPPGKV